MIYECCVRAATRVTSHEGHLRGWPIGGTLDHLAELRALAAERHARAERAREVANYLSDERTREGILRYAENLDRDVARLIVQIAAKGTASIAIDVIY